jgi:hypothetical protein
MWKTEEGSTGRLIQYCLGYFVTYIITGVAVKYFTSNTSMWLPHVREMEYLVYSTIGGNIICLAVIILWRWFKLKSRSYTSVGKLKVPVEVLYIIPSGICTAIVIPTTTLMYLLPISIMVAMVIMRGSIIIISRLVDAIQIKQGILKKKIYWEEEVAVLFAVIAICLDIFYGKIANNFEFIHSVPAMSILGSYIVAYSIRIYIMNYYRNTRGKSVPQDNKGFFAIEQIVSTTTMLIVGFILFKLSTNLLPIVEFQEALTAPTKYWPKEVIAGLAYGAGAFFSVFLFMFKGRTATFSGLVNRLTSLVAGTVATLLFWLMFNGKAPSTKDWISLLFIFVAVGFLTKAEKKRAAELKKQHLIK